MARGQAKIRTNLPSSVLRAFEAFHTVYADATLVVATCRNTFDDFARLVCGGCDRKLSIDIRGHILTAMRGNLSAS